jgi:hypothetical protein
LPTQVHRRALQRALELTGGVEPLAAYLKVPVNAVRFWVNGSSPLPGDVFLRIVDLVLDHSMMDLHPSPAQTPGETKSSPD